MPITERASLQRLRAGYERPFLTNGDRYIVFPEIKDGGRVTGFYFYDSRGSWYYDSIESAAGQKKLISELAVDRETIYELTAQPNGIETVAVFLLPGYDGQKRNKQGPMVLGASVLPVVGAFMSRPKIFPSGYHDPTKATQSELKNWARQKSGTPRAEGSIEKALVRLSTIQVLSPSQIGLPIREELRLRRDWIKAHNLDDRSFRSLMRVLESTCKE